MLTLAFLLTPVAVMADGEEATGTDIRIGNRPKCYAIVKKDDLDIGGELFLNGIPYGAQLNSKGDIVMRNADLTAAVRAAEAIAVYENQHPGNKFTKTDSMNIISGYGMKLIDKGMSDTGSAGNKLPTADYSVAIRGQSTQALTNALTNLLRSLENGAEVGKEFVSRIDAIKKGLSYIRADVQRMHGGTLLRFCCITSGILQKETEVSMKE